MAEEGDDDSASSADGTVVVGDRAPCFDNGVCLAPDGGGDDDDGGDGGDDRGGAPGIGAMRRLGPHSGPTVWSEFGRLARERQESGMDIANLGQGFPDWPPPGFAIQSLVSAATGDPPPSPNSPSSPHQYTRTAGHPALVRQLARRYSRHMDRVIDPMNEVAVTVGASQALYLCLQTLVDEPGRRDEVVLFEPFFDLYANQIRLAGGTPVYVPLTFVPPPTSSSGGGGGGGGGDVDTRTGEARSVGGSEDVRGHTQLPPQSDGEGVHALRDAVHIAGRVGRRRAGVRRHIRRGIQVHRALPPRG